MNIDMNTLGTWFSGVATLFAVVVALRLQRFYERRDRPKLILKFQFDDGDCVPYIPPHFAGGNTLAQRSQSPEREELWVRLCVENTSETAAKDVEIRLISLCRNGEETPEKRPRWWFKASNLDATSVALLPRGLPAYFDIAYIANIKGSSEDLSFYLMIVRPDLKVWDEEKQRIESDDENNKLDIGWTYTLRLALISSNGDAKEYSMRLRVDARRNTDPPAQDLLGSDLLRRRLVVNAPTE